MDKGSYVSVIKEKILFRTYIVFYILLINSSAWSATLPPRTVKIRAAAAFSLFFFDAVMRSVITVIYRQ